MASMLEVLREYKHLAARKRSEGRLRPDLEERLAELKELVDSHRDAMGDSTSGVRSSSRVGAGRARKSPDTVTNNPTREASRAAGSARPTSGHARPTSQNNARPTSGPRTQPTSSSRTRLTSSPAASVRSAPAAPVRSAPAAAIRSVSEEVSRSGPVRPLVRRVQGVSALPRWNWLDNLLERLPSERHRPVAFGILTLLCLLCLSSGLAFGASISSLLPALMAVGGLTWLVVYPGVLGGFELSGRRSDAHLTEADFQIKIPAPEPALFVLAVLGAVVWLMLSGYSSQGVGPVIGYIFVMLFGLMASGFAAALMVRPMAARVARTRAYTQYYAGGVHHLGRNNTKRARKLLNRALEVASDPEEEGRAKDQLERAVEKEADELEQRGFHDQARALRERFSSAQAARRAPPAGRSVGASAVSTITTNEPRLGAPTPPRLLSSDDLRIVKVGVRAEGEHAKAFELARALERKGRNRESLEVLVDVGLPITASLAREAAKEYMAQGMLRSADAIYEAMGERQIPEFYRALAVEVARSSDGQPDPKACMRLCGILQDVDEPEAAARLAVQGALSSAGTGEERRTLGLLAAEICEIQNLEIPAELHEVLGRNLEAARIYERENRSKEAIRCFRKAIDMYLDTNRPGEAVTSIQRLIRLDEEIPNRYLEALVEELIEMKASGQETIDALEMYRRRKSDDPKTAHRLFELYLEQGKAKQALSELDRLGLQTNSSPELLLKDYKSVIQRFPEDTVVRARYAKVLIRVGKVADAAQQVEWLLSSPMRQESPLDLSELIDSLYEWGHVDPELRYQDAVLRFESDRPSESLERIERYVQDGGKNPEASALVEKIMASDLILPNGGPNYAAHLRIAHIHMRAGRAGDALKYLDVARGSPEHRVDAEILLARAELMASNPKRAIHLLREAIDGRHPTKTPEHHFELARAYEAIGDTKQAQKIDAVLERFVPGFGQQYRTQRPEFEKADTIWVRASDAAGGDTDDVGATEYGLPDDTDAGVGETAPRGEMTSATEAQPQEADLASVLAPRYKLIKRIGSGGMGDVHLAEDEALGREVAVKVLRRTLATDLFIAKFKDEARMVARLSHPGIVSVYDIGQKGDWSYIVMEYVAGPNLATLLTASIPPSRIDVIEYIAQVADAMAYAHDQGVVHRDLKPANILVGRDRVVKVTDFGIARVLQTQDEETAFSAAGLQVGTVNYMAPEQITGKGVDTRTDIYLLGTTLYYALARRYPFSGDQVMIQKLRSNPKPLTDYVPNVSQALNQTVMRCLARSPAHRFATMKDMAQALRRLPDASSPDAATQYEV